MIELWRPMGPLGFFVLGVAVLAVVGGVAEIAGVRLPYSLPRMIRRLLAITLTRH